MNPYLFNKYIWYNLYLIFDKLLTCFSLYKIQNLVYIKNLYRFSLQKYNI